MPKDLGFAVTGLGMGKHHCMAIETAPGAELVAVCDVDEERLQPVAEQYDCKAYTSFGDLLQDEDVDVVNLATPSGMHAAMGIEAAAAGKHLIVEKPADIAVGRIDELLAAGQQHGAKISCIFQARCVPLNLRIREAIQAGRLGKLVGIHGAVPWYRQQSYYEGPHGTWKGTWDMDGGGSLMNQGVHTVDLIQWFGGPVETVAGMFGVFEHEIEAEDQTVAILQFASGALGTLHTTTCYYPGYDQRVAVYGSAGSIIKEEGALVSWRLAGDEDGKEEQELMDLYGASGQKSGAVDPMAVSFDGHTQIVADMVEAIREEREPAITLASARHAVEIVNAIYEAGRTGGRVQLGTG